MLKQRNIYNGLKCQTLANVLTKKKLLWDEQTYPWVLAGMWGEILKGPLNILMRSQLPGECRRLLTTQSQNAIVGREHPPIKEHHILVIMVC